MIAEIVIGDWHRFYPVVASGQIPRLGSAWHAHMFVSRLGSQNEKVIDGFDGKRNERFAKCLMNSLEEDFVLVQILGRVLPCSSPERFSEHRKRMTCPSANGLIFV